MATTKKITDPQEPSPQEAAAMFSKYGPRFPFRPGDGVSPEQARQAVDSALRGVDRMLFMFARDRAGSIADESEIEEIVQGCRQWLWQKSLPQYDAWRESHSKVSTFIYLCATNFIRQEVRALIRRRSSKRYQRLILDGSDGEGGSAILAGLAAPGVGVDRRIERIAQDVLSNPDKYFTAAQVQVFKTITENPGILMKDLARRLGYQRASSLSTMMRRIKERIKEIDIEEFEGEPAPGGEQ